jgi:hypothetical protein
MWMAQWSVVELKVASLLAQGYSRLGPSSMAQVISLYDRKFRSKLIEVLYKQVNQATTKISSTLMKPILH